MKGPDEKQPPNAERNLEISGVKKQDYSDSEVDKETLSHIQNFEDILEMIGPWGRWNILVFVFGCSCTFTNALHMLTYEFLGATPNYWCHVDALRDANWTAEQILALAIPIKNDTDGGRNEGCLMYNYDYEIAASIGFEASMENLDKIMKDDPASTISCHSRDFNLTEYKSTVVTEWDLVCERRALYSTTQAATMIGTLLCYLCLGSILDYFGRRKVVLGSVFSGLLFGLSVSFVTSYTAYVIMKTLMSAVISGYYFGCLVLILELCIPSQRSSVGSLFCVPWALGYMAAPGIAYLVREWRWLQAAYSIPIAALFIYIWVLPESPRWLIEKERYQDALDVISQAAGKNGKTLPPSATLLPALKNLRRGNSSEGPNATCTRVRSLLTYWVSTVTDKELRFRTLVVFVNFFLTAMVYFGLSLNSTNLSADPYLYLFLGGVIELPCYIVMWPIIAYLGRRPTLTGLLMLCGLCIAALTIIISLGLDVPVSVMMALSLGGKMAITIVLHLLCIYVVEMYPTRLRSLVSSQGIAISRIGSLVSPYIIDILGEDTEWAPSAVFAISAIIAGLLAVSLPETKGINLTEDVDSNYQSESNDKRDFCSTGTYVNKSFSDSC